LQRAKIGLATAAQKEFHVVIEKGEDGYYVASVVELPGCHTQAKNLEELDRRIREVIELYLEAEGKEIHIPEFIALKKVRV
jgi:predicted RNase H-like HicB family nuclease